MHNDTLTFVWELQVSLYKPTHKKLGHKPSWRKQNAPCQNPLHKTRPGQNIPHTNTHTHTSTVNTAMNSIFLFCITVYTPATYMALSH